MAGATIAEENPAPIPISDQSPQGPESKSLGGEPLRGLAVPSTSVDWRSGLTAQVEPDPGSEHAAFGRLAVNRLRLELEEPRDLQRRVSEAKVLRILVARAAARQRALG